MKRFSTISLFLILTISVVAQVSDEALLRKNFDSYKTFYNNGNGEEAVKFVDSRTIKYYDDIAEIIKNADSLKVESLSLLDKTMVLTIRHTVSKENILAFNGKTLLIYTINHGVNDKRTTIGFTIGKVTIDNNSAKGQVTVLGKDSPYFLNFYKEKGDWKFDLTSSFPITFQAMQKLADQLGGPNKMIFASLKLITGKAPGRDIWHPVK